MRSLNDNIFKQCPHLKDSPILKAPNAPWVKDLYFGMIMDIRHIAFEEDWDYPIIIDGPEGVGKSALATHIAGDIDPAFRTPKGMEERMTWDGKKLVDMIYSLPPTAIIDDESGFDLFSRDAMKKENKRIIQMTMVCREKNMVPILLMPNMMWIDPYLFHHRAQLWIRCESRISNKGNRIRGFAEVHTPYRLKYKKMTIWRHQFTFRFPDFSDELGSEYRRLKAINTKSRIFEGKVEDTETGVIRRARDNGMKQEDIGKLLGISTSTVCRRLKEIIRDDENG